MVFLIIAGVLLMAAAIIAFRKFPGIKLKVIWITLLIGAILLITGILLLLFIPGKGLLSSGRENVTGNDDVSGVRDESADIPASPGTVVIRGSEISINGEVMPDITAFDAYIASSDWQGGYELVDDYASYAVMEAVKSVLEDRGKTLLSERAVE